MEARITSESQTFRLRERLAETAVSHGATLRADLPNVRIGPPVTIGPTVPVAFFCNLGPVRVREVIATGDGGLLPASGVELGGLEVPASGRYDIYNALITSNGALHVVVDSESRVMVAMDP